MQSKCFNKTCNTCIRYLHRPYGSYDIQEDNIQEKKKQNLNQKLKTKCQILLRILQYC